MGNAVKKVVKPVVKKLPSIIGSAVGMYFGGPAGAVIGGSIGGSMERGKGNKWKGAAQGAMIGATYAAGAPAAGRTFGANPSGFMGRVTGMNSPSLLHQLGVSSAPAVGGGLGFLGKGGVLSGMIGGTGTMLPLVASLGLGMLGRKGMMQEPNEIGYRDDGGGDWGNPQSPNEPFNPYSMGRGMRNYLNIPHGYLDSPQVSLFGGENNPEPRIQDSIKRINLATGGYVPGYVRNQGSSGDADDVYAEIPKDSYVLNATDLSLLGNGSPDNGALKIANMENNLVRKGLAKPYTDESHPRLRVKLSNNEIVVRPEVVAALGDNNIERGAKVIDRARMKLRKQKGVAKILPPKTKSLEYYFGGKVR